MKTESKRSFLAVLISVSVATLLVISVIIGQEGKKAEQESVSSLLRVYFIDVGQGDAELVMTPTGETALIDTGSIDTSEDLIESLKKCGVKSIDYLFLSHPHEDHIGGAERTLGSFPIGKVIISEDESDFSLLQRALDKATERGAGIETATAGSKFPLGEAEITVLAPLTLLDDHNENSLVLRLDYGKTRFLFTGDAGMTEEMTLLKEYSKEELNCDVLKLGHHGSESSSTEAFLDAVSPLVAVVSCGKENEFGHPHKEVLDRLSKRGIAVYRTDLSGTVLILSDGSTVSVSD